MLTEDASRGGLIVHLVKSSKSTSLQLKLDTVATVRLSLSSLK